MLNNVVLVGRLKKISTLVNDGAIITIAVPRSIANENGEYLTDYIDCRLFGSIAKNVLEYCKEEDILGVKGRLQSNDETEFRLELVADKITFLSSKSE